MKLLNFNIIKLTTCLIVGVLIGFYSKISIKTALFLFLIVFVGFCLCFIFLKEKKRNYLFGVFIFLTFIALGIINTKINDETLHSSHYINLKNNVETYNYISFKVTKRLKPDAYNTKYIADASNYKSYVQRWKTTCMNKKIPFHSTYEKGAFVLK